MKNKDGKMDKILKQLFIFLLFFVIAQQVTFFIKGSTPDTLIQYVFIACTGELSIMGVIKSTKHFKRDIIGKSEDLINKEFEEESEE